MIILLCSLWLSAGTIPDWDAISIPRIFEQANIVMKGRVESVSQIREVNEEWHGHTVKMKIFVARVSPIRIYKGRSDTNISITYERPGGNVCAVSQCESMSVDDYDLFFLTRSGDQYQVLSDPAGRFAISDKEGESHKQGLVGLESDLFAGLEGPDEGTRLTSIELLGSMSHLSSMAPLLKLLPRGDIATQATVYVALLRLHEYKELKNGCLLLEEPSQDPYIQYLQARYFDIVSEIRDENTVPTLLAFARSKSDRLREASVHALREMDTQSAVPVFVAALDDDVELIRYDAVLGLASVEKKWELAPSIDNFRSNEPKFINAWKEWWRESGKQKYM